MASQVASDDEIPASVKPSSHRWWALGVLTAVYSINFIDRMIVGVLGQPIKEEFHLADWQVGLLSGLAFALTYTLVGIPVARIAERKNRVKIISIAAVIWSLMTAACGMAANFVQLLLFRAGVGVGEAGCAAPSHSLIADYFRADERARALSIFHLAVPIAVLVGSVAGGFAAETWGWRVTLYILCLPGLLLGLLLWLTVREPMRGMSESSSAPVEDVPSFGEVLRRLSRVPAFIHILIGGTLVVAANAAVKAFTVPYLMREYDLTVGHAGGAYGLVAGTAAIVGTIGGGFLADALGKRHQRWLAWVPALSLLFGGPLYLLALHQNSWEMSVVFLGLSATVMYGYIGPSFAALHNVISPRMRATTVSLVFLVHSLIGFGFGPPVLGGISDMVAAMNFTGGNFNAICHAREVAAPMVTACQEASAAGLEFALSLLTVLFIWSAAHFYFAGRNLAAKAI